MWTRGKILFCPTCVKIFSNLCKAKRSFKPNVHPHDSEIENRRVRQENCYNKYFVPPPIHRILPWKLYFMIFRENFPSEMKPGKCSAKKNQQKWAKKWKKGEGEETKGKHREGSVSFKQNILKLFFHFSPNLQKLQFCTRNRLKPE